MSTSTPYRSSDLFNSASASASGNAKPPPSTSLSSLLAQANSLNHVERDTELPQIRFGIDEIERMSGAVAGKGKRRVDRGEG
jgi:nuclear pore complex protein Nup93